MNRERGLLTPSHKGHTQVLNILDNLGARLLLFRCIICNTTQAPFSSTLYLSLHFASRMPEPNQCSSVNSVKLSARASKRQLWFSDAGSVRGQNSYLVTKLLSGLGVKLRQNSSGVWAELCQVMSDWAVIRFREGLWRMTNLMKGDFSIWFH